MTRNIRTSRPAVQHTPALITREPQKVFLEVNSSLGRQVFAMDLKAAHQPNNLKRLEIFLHANGYNSVDPKILLKRTKAQYVAHAKTEHYRLRIEKLGFLRDVPLALPRIGQSHELEFAALSSKLDGVDKIGHAVDFFQSSNKLNGVSAFKIVSETLGKTADFATTEFVLGPAATKDEYFEIISKVEQFQNRVKAYPVRQAIPISEVVAGMSLGDQKITPKKVAQGIIWHGEYNNVSAPCVHTSRGAPIRSMSAVLRDPESGLFHEPAIILSHAEAQTDFFVNSTGLVAPHGKKLWETINLGIWMAACEGIIQPLMHNDLKATYKSNNTFAKWTRYAGKNFFGALPRFCAGDLIRTGGLQTRDIEQLHSIFAGSDPHQNKTNINLLVKSATTVADNFLKHLDQSHDEEDKEIVKVIRDIWFDVEHWVRRDLESDFVPRANKKRYPSDRKEYYGTKVNTEATSPSFAGSQFLPRRERLSAAKDHDAPVSGAFEFRQGYHAGNKNAAAYFSTTPKRKLDALEASWNKFEQYVGQLQKKPRIV